MYLTDIESSMDLLLWHITDGVDKAAVPAQVNRDYLSLCSACWEVWVADELQNGKLRCVERCRSDSMCSSPPRNEQLLYACIRFSRFINERVWERRIRGRTWERARTSQKGTETQRMRSRQARRNTDLYRQRGYDLHGDSLQNSKVTTKLLCKNYF